MAVTNQTRTQRMEALQVAHATRMHRAEVKRAIHAGELDVRHVLAGKPHRLLLTMPLGDLLTAVPMLGEVKAEALLESCNLNIYTQLGNATARQRGGLVAAISAWDTQRKARQ